MPFLICSNSSKIAIANLGEFFYPKNSAKNVLFQFWSDMKFIGRREELNSLKSLFYKKSASLVVIRGRRRIGKSRLALEFSKQFSRAYILSGIPPVEGLSAAMQREEFLRQLQENKLPVYRSDNWGDLFFDLAKACATGRVLLVLDEITWMGSKDPTFLSQLKNAWDLHFKKNPELIMIISGSNSAWIEKNILSSTGFFGRISSRMTLGELPLKDCNAFWSDWPGIIDPYEKFKILSVTGGVPRYLEELRPNLSAEGNLLHLCFDAEGLLFREFDQIFHDLFLKKGPFYKEIILCLIEQQLSMSELALKLDRSKGGDLSEALAEMVQAGFLARDFTWSIGSKKKSATSRYRVKDNYFRFYLKYIFPNKEQIEAGKIKKLPSGWFSILGFQFENLVLNNGDAVARLLNISLDEIVFSGPYLQTARARRKGCQIDYLIQTRFNSLYLCEVKFKQGLIGMEIIDEIKGKLDALKLPKGYSCRPILIHVNGVNEEVIDSGFFANIIDFSELLIAD
jgi:AAA+ ATPase superfamily predicted ATPase